MSSRANRMADRISSLPDILLCHILSFLPTKEAVATSVLSKRWRPLWLSISSLNFNDKSYLQNNETYFRFLKMVYAVMLLRDVALPIGRFELKCMSSRCDSSIVNTWVMAAIQRKVKQLSLSLPSTINLPQCILTSSTLVVLKLKGLTVNRVSFACLPSLKTLHLRMVHFQKYRCFDKILSACPVLEDLLIRSIEVANLFSGIQSPVTLFAKSHTFLNLTHMELTFNRNSWNWLIKLLHHCPNLQIVVIDQIETNPSVRTLQNWVYPQFVPKCLSSRLRMCCVQNYKGEKDELQFARYIMQNARVLRTLKIISISSSNPQAKLEMIKNLSSSPRISVTSKLSFK